jgi:hypothetical protein
MINDAASPVAALESGKVVPIILDVAVVKDTTEEATKALRAAVPLRKAETERHYGCTVVLTFENQYALCVDSISRDIYRCTLLVSLILLLHRHVCCPYRVQRISNCQGRVQPLHFLHV